MQKFFIEQITVELRGDLKYLRAFTLMSKPRMLEAGSDQYQFQILNLFNMIANDTFRSGAILNEIQFKFLVHVQRKIEFRFHSGKHHETITLREGCDLLHCFGYSHYESIFYAPDRGGCLQKIRTVD